MSVCLLLSKLPSLNCNPLGQFLFHLLPPLPFQNLPKASPNSCWKLKNKLLIFNGNVHQANCITFLQSNRYCTFSYQCLHHGTQNFTNHTVSFSFTWKTEKKNIDLIENLLQNQYHLSWNLQQYKFKLFNTSSSHQTLIRSAQKPVKEKKTRQLLFEQRTEIDPALLVSTNNKKSEEKKTEQLTLSVKVSPVRVITSALVGGSETQRSEKRRIEATQRYRMSTRFIVGVRIRLRRGLRFSFE